MLTLEQFRMRKKTGPFDDKVKTDAQKMAKQPKYKGSTSKLEADIRKKHGDKNANHFVIQNIIRKHAETNESVGKTPGDRSYYNLQKAKELAKKAGHDYDKLPQYDRRHNDHKDYFDNKAKNEAVTSADRTPQNVIGSDGKVRVRMVPTTKKSDTSEVYARPKGKVTVLKKGDPRIKAIQDVQKRKAKSFKDLARKEMGEDQNTKIDEISKKKAQRYLGYASRDMFNLGKRDQRASDIDRLGGSHPDQDYKKGPERKAAMRLRGIDRASKILMKNKKTSEAVNPHDDEGANHIIMQLRKSVSLRGMRPVEFKDGKKVKVSMADAQKFLTKYNKSKPMDKEKMQAMAMKSHDGFKKALGESVQEDMSDFERRMRMMRQAGSSQKINQKKRDDKEKKSMAAKAAVDMRARRNEVKEDRMAGKYKKGQTIVRGQWPNPDKWAEEYIMPNADKKGVKIYSSGPSFVIEKL